MKFKITDRDKEQWNEIHNSKSKEKFWNKYETLMKEFFDIEEQLEDLIGQNQKYVQQLTDMSKSCDKIPNYPQHAKEQIVRTKESIENDNIAVNAYANTILILMDICTYGNRVLLSDDEWEWRTYARHIYTILYEHRNAFNTALNEFFRIAKKLSVSDELINKAIIVKRDFTKWIEEQSKYAHEIRNNVDAHHKGDFMNRLFIIEGMSYYTISEVLLVYWQKAGALLQNLVPLQREMFEKANKQMTFLFEVINNANQQFKNKF